MSFSAELILIGDELLNGTIVDANGAWFGQQIAQRGLRIAHFQTVPDTANAIIEAMKLAASRASLIITSGGLGPTVDDLTAAAAAQFLKEPLVTHQEALKSIRDRRAAVGRTLTDADRKQADLPASACALANPVGTAPGFSICAGTATFYHLPGVPHEFRTLAERYILPKIDASVSSLTASCTWKCFGVTESGLATMVSALEVENIELHYRAHFPEIHLTAIAPDAEVLSRFSTIFEATAGPYIFGGAHDSYAERVVSALITQQATVAVAESCTGGLIGKMLTDVPGASAVFEAGFITYSNDAKMRWLGVPQTTLDAHGAVSRETVIAMAQGVRDATGATLGVATSGIAGPGGGSIEKPVGSIHIALASHESVRHRFLQLPFDRERNRVATAYGALELIRKHCLEA